jgi:TPR repeat protein
MLHLYQYAFYYFQKASLLRPSDARMWSAVGNCLLKLGMKNQAIVTYERAVSAGDAEGIATRDLARLYRDEALPLKAAELYYKYLLCNLFNNEPQVGPEEDVDSASMPSSLEEFVQKFQDLTGMLEVDSFPDAAVDSEQAEALLFLGNYFKALSDITAAEYFCSKWETILLFFVVSYLLRIDFFRFLDLKEMKQE